MTVWRIRPVTPPNASRWQGRQVWDEVVVKAPKAAFARIVAARLEVDANARGVGNESVGPKSGFMDEKLYWIGRLDSTAIYGSDESADMSVLVARKGGEG